MYIAHHCHTGQDSLQSHGSIHAPWDARVHASERKGQWRARDENIEDCSRVSEYTGGRAECIRKGLCHGAVISCWRMNRFAAAISWCALLGLVYFSKVKVKVKVAIILSSQPLLRFTYWWFGKPYADESYLLPFWSGKGGRGILFILFQLLSACSPATAAWGLWFVFNRAWISYNPAVLSEESCGHRNYGLNAAVM